MENREFLKNQMTYIGFGNKSILDALDKAISQGHPRFTLTVLPENGSGKLNRGKFELNFNQSSQTDRHFLNNFKTTLLDNNNIPLKAQLFHVNGTKGVTAKESINLLEGRSVKTVLQYNGQDSQVFVKLNFDEKNKYGNYKYKSFNENFGVDVKDILNKAQGQAGLKIEGTKLEQLVKSLEKGNLVKSIFLVNGKDTTGYVALEAEFKNLNYFDKNLTRILHSQLGNNQQTIQRDQNNVFISVDNRNPKASREEAVIIADISEKQITKLAFFQDNGKAAYPSITPKQLASVPKSVFGLELSYDQRRELLFGNEVKLDNSIALKVQATDKRELHTILTLPDGGNEISTLYKSSASFDTPSKELKPFENSEETPERSKSISR
ncbi:hypothetical protein [Sphingobacterium siyangense]|uniref:hypothetical protein n=1 Tax=Sphingobacterium siyangense TaxID=459529 RepID=UPI0028A20CC2|nr:hypothetical protein [Sphingobacterium siyangense]